MPLSQRHDANAARRTLSEAATDAGDVALRDGFDHVPGCACVAMDRPPNTGAACGSIGCCGITAATSIAATSTADSRSLLGLRPRSG